VHKISGIYHIYNLTSYYKIELDFSINFWGDSLEDVMRLIEENYGIEVEGIEKIKNVYKVKTKEGYKCLKASKYDFGQFQFIIACIKYLLDKGFEAVLPFCSARNGKSFIEFNTGYAFLCEWVESREANFKNPIELKMCIETLSSLHLMSRGFTPPPETRGRNYYGRWMDKFKKRCDELLYFKALIKSKDKISEFDSIYQRHFDSHYRQGLKTIKDIEGSKYIQIMDKHKVLKGFCHHDTANHNFLITGDSRVYMIDFDYCVMDSYLHDLTSIIIRNLKHGNWNFYTFDYILDIYSKNIYIDDDELYLIFCFMEFPQDFWQVGLQYYVEKQPWGEEFFIKKLNRIVGDSVDRMEFLRDFETSFLEG